MKAYEIRAALRDSAAIVTFKKKNGDIRELVCTLQHDRVPAIYGSTPPSDDSVTVWDLEHNGWRSFKLKSLIKFEPISA